MSYYNEMYIPITNDNLEEDLLYFYDYEEGFENMLELMKLPQDYIKIDSDGSSYVVFKPVKGAIDTLRPRDLDWNWHDRRCYYGDPDCFIFIHDLHNRVDWVKIGSQEHYTRVEELVKMYQTKLDKYGKHLVIFPM